MVVTGTPNRFFAALAILALCGCSANLDADCAELFEDMTAELDRVLDADSFEDKVARLRELEDYAPRIRSLSERASETISAKITSGEIYSDLNPDGPSDPGKQKFIFDDLNARKAVALNAFNSRRFQIGNDVLEAAGQSSLAEGSYLYDAVRLSFMCNQTLR